MTRAVFKVSFRGWESKMSGVSLSIRPRRNRKNDGVRRLVRETTLTVDDLVMPLFLHNGNEDEPIESMPGCVRWSLGGLVNEACEIYELGSAGHHVIFPAIEEELKTPGAEECFNDLGLVPRAIREIKKACPELVILTDVALGSV